MAQLLDLPDEVVESSILPYLSWNDLLRCRRISKAIKYITDDFIRVEMDPKLAPEIEISEKIPGKSLKAYISMGIHSSKLFLNNPSGNGFYDNLDASTLTKFMEVFAPKIKYLRVFQLSLYPCFNEWTFLESLQSLQTFKAYYIGIGLNPSVTQLDKIVKEKYELAKSDPRFNDHSFPPNFYKTLEILLICNSFGEVNYKIDNIHNRLPAVLEEMENLKYITFPVHLRYANDLVHGPQQELDEAHTVLTSMFTQFYSFINKQHKANKKHLTCIDFLTYHKNLDMDVYVTNCQVSPYFLALCKLSNERGVFLWHVNAIWLSGRLHQQNEVLKSVDIGNPVLSLVNLDPCVIPLKMLNLQKIDICRTSQSSAFADRQFRRQEWPALKILTIKVDSKSERSPKQLLLLYKFFFKDIFRHQMQELTITFDSKGGLRMPRTEDIVESCPNLKVLQISNWPGTNKALTKLWRGLPALEQVALGNCTELGNVAFVGDDVDNPVFLLLKNLRKLTLSGLDQMPKISDTLFSLVLSRMKLSHLIFTSDKPLIKVTRAGIDALLKSSLFAESIKKFPFHGWSMADVSDDEFTAMGKQFRSSQML